MERKLSLEPVVLTVLALAHGLHYDLTAVSKANLLMASS